MMKADDLEQPAAAATQRDFLYQRRLVSLRPFVTDDGVPGLNLRFAGGETMAVRIDLPLLDLFHRAIGRLKEGAASRSIAVKDRARATSWSAATAPPSEDAL
jgi:hypothetical protein